MSKTPKPLLLLILDGWGYRTEPENNAIVAANTPHWNALWQKYPHMLIDASGQAVGLPDQQMGNSEVGHMHMGAGRVILQDLSRIDQAIRERTFAENPAFVTAFEKCLANQSALHILGLVSPGGVHSHEQHILSLVESAARAGVKKIYIHAFLDGRDTPPQSAMHSLETLHLLCQTASEAHQAEIRVVSIIGRYYAMDRDQRWDRTQAAYELVVNGSALFHSNHPGLALTLAYARDETDEFVKASAIHLPQEEPVKIEDGDAVIFMNFRNDRARQLSRALSQPHFAGFHRSRVPQLSTFVTLTHYADDIVSAVAYPPMKMNNGLGEWLAIHNKTQLRIAETEKYAHVTFFFNGGVETPYAGEDRILIASPKVATYDQAPEMSAGEITEKLVAAISEKKYDVIIANFANADMVGHTGNFQATVQAINFLDDCIGKIIKALQEVGGEALITADHGNAELMYDKDTHQAHTAHTNFLVPLLYVGAQGQFKKAEGTLIDVAPTMLALLNMDIPKEMTGTVLLEK